MFRVMFRRVSTGGPEREHGWPSLNVLSDDGHLTHFFYSFSSPSLNQQSSSLHFKPVRRIIILFRGYGACHSHNSNTKKTRRWLMPWIDLARGVCVRRYPEGNRNINEKQKMKAAQPLWQRRITRLRRSWSRRSYLSTLCSNHFREHGAERTTGDGGVCLLLTQLNPEIWVNARNGG